jgi:hypothetical protein
MLYICAQSERPEATLYGHYKWGKYYDGYAAWNCLTVLIYERVSVPKKGTLWKYRAGWMRLGLVLSLVIAFAGSYWVHGRRWDSVSNLAVSIHWEDCGANPDTFVLNEPHFGHLCSETYNSWLADRRVEVWEWTGASFVIFALIGATAYLLFLMLGAWIVRGFIPGST